MPAILLLSLFSATEPQAPSAAGGVTAVTANGAAERPAYKVLRAVDGDTLVLLSWGRTSKVRLIGVAPVVEGRSKKAFDATASRALTDLLGDQSVYLNGASGLVPERDGRIPAFVERASDGLAVNLELVRRGFGRAGRDLPPDLLARFRAEEQQARDGRRGLWAPDAVAEYERTRAKWEGEKTAAARKKDSMRKEAKLRNDEAIERMIAFQDMVGRARRIMPGKSYNEWTADPTEAKLKTFEEQLSKVLAQGGGVCKNCDKLTEKLISKMCVSCEDKDFRGRQK